jgi:hypothetical protein
MLHAKASVYPYEMHLLRRYVGTCRLDVVIHGHSWAKRNLAGEMVLPGNENWWIIVALSMLVTVLMKIRIVDVGS